MKYLFLISSQLFICLSCIAQDTLKYFVNNSGKVVSTRDSADYIRIIMPPDSNDRSLYIVKDYYTDGKVKMIGQSTSRQPVQLTGTCVEYFHKGGRKRITDFNQAQVLEYYPNGKLYVVRSNLVNPRIYVPVECRDSTGKVLMKDGTGYFKQYDPDFKYVVEEGTFKNGVQEGIWTKNRSANDSLKIVCTYVNGIPGSGVTFDSHNIAHPFDKIEEQPQFKGGMEALYKFLSKNFYFHETTGSQDFHGEILLQIVIEKDGSVSNVKVLRGMGTGYDEEAVKVIRKSPKWEPGKQYGLPTRLTVNLPVNLESHTWINFMK